MRNPLFALVAALLVPACRSLYEEVKKPIPDVDLEYGSIARAQFDDIPAPEGFVLRSQTMESYSYQCGSFRSGKLIYDGPASPANVASYLRERLPLHGWEILSENSGERGRLLSFRKATTELTCDISRDPKSGRRLTTVLMIIAGVNRPSEASSTGT